jgi:succinate dehydrogenase/fumarate reductase flavoprotein subunit
MVNGVCIGVLCLSIKNGTLYWIFTKNIVLAINSYKRAYFLYTSVYTSTGDGNAMVVRERILSMREAKANTIEA